MQCLSSDKFTFKTDKYPIKSVRNLLKCNFGRFLNFIGMDRNVYAYAFSRLLAARQSVGRKLFERFNDLSELLGMDEKELLAVLGGDPELVREIRQPGFIEDASRELEWAESKGVKVLYYWDNEYPQLLNECNDAPVMLYYVGNADLNAHFNISVVGTRLASSYGRETCHGLVSSVVNDDVLIVSGMAYGIDASAHKAALEMGVPTVGVLPCGIDEIYPQAHRDMAKRMLESGGIITEFPPGFGVRKWHFLKRNRIIAGISRAVVVVESRIKGGAMRTAEYANSYNREVYAVPGRLCDTNSDGCNFLISRNMAQICTYSSFRESCGLGDSVSPYGSNEKSLFLFDNDKKEKILLSLKTNSERDVDWICIDTGLSLDDVVPLVLELELEGRVVSDEWGRYKIKD